MIRTFPLQLEEMKFRSHSIVGIYELNEKIVYIRFALVDVPLETPIENTIYPSIVIVDWFSRDFKHHTQKHISYKIKELGLLRNSCTEFYSENGRFYLNTFKTASSWSDFSNTFAKIFEITDSDIIELSPSPEPEEKVYNDSKTYRFGDFTIRMASSFKMECHSAQTNDLLWTLRLTAYLYTELEERNGIVYFGTAGKGGHFYGVSLHNGEIIFDLNTGGTIVFAWLNSRIVLSDRKGDLIIISPEDGSGIRRFRFDKMKLTYDPYFLVRENRIYTVLSGKDGMYAACVDCNENQ